MCQYYKWKLTVCRMTKKKLYVFVTKLVMLKIQYFLIMHCFFSDHLPLNSNTFSISLPWFYMSISILQCGSTGMKGFLPLK